MRTPSRIAGARAGPARRLCAAAIVWLLLALAPSYPDPAARISCRVTIVPSPDTDGDGLTDAHEAWLGTSPTDADSDNDALPDAWEYRKGLCPTNPAGSNGPLGDPDGDYCLNRDEYTADTDPLDALSLLRLTGVEPADGGMRITWRGGELVTQLLERVTILSDTGMPWTVVFTGVPPTSVEMNHVDYDVPPRTFFYRIKAVREP